MGKVLRTAYATYPTVKLQGYKTDAKTGEKKFGFIKELLFGDYMRPYIENGDYVRLKVGGKEYVKIRCRNADGYIYKLKNRARGRACRVIASDYNGRSPGDIVGDDRNKTEGKRRVGYCVADERNRYERNEHDGIEYYGKSEYHQFVDVEYHRESSGVTEAALRSVS